MTVPTGPPSHEALHRDIALANQYRLEFIKHTMSLAAAALVFTITFRKDIIGTASPQHTSLIGIGWTAMIVSLLGGLGHLAGWDRFYITYRDHKDDRVAGDAARAEITTLRRLAMIVQLLGFFIGLICIAAYCLLNM